MPKDNSSTSSNGLFHKLRKQITIKHLKDIAIINWVLYRIKSIPGVVAQIPAPQPATPVPPPPHAQHTKSKSKKDSASSTKTTPELRSEDQSNSNSNRRSRTPTVDESKSKSRRRPKSPTADQSDSHSKRRSLSPTAKSTSNSRRLPQSRTQSRFMKFSQSNLSPSIDSLTLSWSLSTADPSTISRLVDWVKSKTRSRGSYSLSFDPDTNKYTYSLVDWVNQSNMTNQTNGTFGLPSGPISTDPLSHVLPTAVAVALSNTATGAVIVSSLIFPNSANTISTILRMVNYCGPIGDLNPLLDGPPLQVRISSSDPQDEAMNGAIIFMTSLTGMVLLLYALSGHFRKHSLPALINEGMARLVATIVPYFGPNAIQLIVTMLSHAVGGDVGLAGGALVAWLTIYFGLMAQVYRIPSPDDESKFSLSPLYESTVDFKNIKKRLLFFVDLGADGLLAALSGVKPNTTSCGTIAGSMLAVSLANLLYVAKFRPYRSWVEQGLMFIKILTQITLSGLNIAALHDDGLVTSIAWVEFIAFCFSYVQLGLLTFLLIKEKCAGYREAHATPISSPNISVLTLPQDTDAVHLSLQENAAVAHSSSPNERRPVDNPTPSTTPTSPMIVSVSGSFGSGHEPSMISLDVFPTPNLPLHEECYQQQSSDSSLGKDPSHSRPAEDEFGLKQEEVNDDSQLLAGFHNKPQSDNPLLSTSLFSVFHRKSEEVGTGDGISNKRAVSPADIL